VKNLRSIIIGVLLSTFLSLNAFANSSDNGADNRSRYAAFQHLIDAGKYQQAIKRLETALKDSPDDANLLNLIAYSHRNLENYDVALKHYQMALKIEPKHRGANEYLGELYLQLKQPDNAQLRLKVLDKACFFGCEEYDELEEAIQEYRKQNPS
jgi:tetratricopeptide (TPR) repeat protein